MELGAALVSARLLHHSAALVLFGAALFPVYAFGRVPAPVGFAPALKRVCLSAGLLAVLGGALTLMVTAANMAGDLAAAVQPDVLVTASVGTEFGGIWLGRLAVGVLMVALVLGGARRFWPPLSAAVFLASVALTGHARVETGLAGLAHVAVDGVHLLAAGAWLGALAPLGWLLIRRPEAEGTAEALRRFAGVGAASVAALAATGVVNAAFLIDDPAAVLSTTYGRLLGLKIGLFAIMLGLAASNRFALVPRLGGPDHPAAIRRLRRHVVLEQLFGLLVVAAVALLGTLDPAV